MPSDALFMALANAKSQPSRGFRTFENAVSAAEAPAQGYLGAKQAQAQLMEQRLKPYEIYSKIAENAGTDVANRIFKANGLPIPDISSSSGQSLDEMEKQFEARPMSFGPRERTMLATARNLSNQQREFAITKQQQLASKKEEIEKDFQNKNDALANAEDAINSSLELKRKSGTSGPISGGIRSVASNLTSGAIGNDTYQLNKNNELWRSALQHAVQVNRFNPQEVSFIGGGALAQPGEPFETSAQKAKIAIDAIRRQRNQIFNEKNARLASLGISQEVSTSNPNTDSGVPGFNNDPAGLFQ